MKAYTVLLCVFVFSGTGNLFTFARTRMYSSMPQCDDCVSVRLCESALKFAFMVEQGFLPVEQRRTFFNAMCGYDVDDPRIPKVCCSAFPVVKSRVPFLDPIETHRNFGLLPDSCGGIDGTRIINGDVAKLYEFPWMALIVYNTSDGLKFRCSGSIINSRYVLTAAHCTINTHTGEFKKIAGVRIGEIDYSTSVDCQGRYPDMICESKIQDIEVEEIIPHEYFFTLQPKEDIALLRLSEPIIMYNNAAPICLPLYSELRNMNLTGLTGTVAGWGVTENRTESTKLMKVIIPISTDGDCPSYNNNTDYKNSTVFCAGEINKDSSRGDSGGPFMIESDFNGSTRLVQLGIVSQGPDECGSSEPGVYTDVTKYMDWILDNIKA